MEAYKMLFLLRDLMKSMSELGIKMDDYKYIGLCQEYNELVSKGEKREYARAVLSRKYSVSESTVFRIITRMTKPIKT
jgi:thymidylate synthase ThyX